MRRFQARLRPTDLSLSLRVSRSIHVCGIVASIDIRVKINNPSRLMTSALGTIVRATQVHPTPALPSNPTTSTTSPPPSPNGDSNFFQNLARPALVLLMATFALIAFVIGTAIYMRLLRNHRRQQLQPALPAEAPFPEKTRPEMYTAMLQPLKHTQDDKWQQIMVSRSKHETYVLAHEYVRS